MAHEPDARSSAQRAPARTVTRRAVGIGLGCAVALSIITPYTDLVMQTSLIACNHLPIGPVFLLFVMVGVNGLVGRLAPGRRLSAGEMIVVFTIMLVASGIVSFGVTANLFPSLVAPFYFANPVNRWAQVFHEHIPRWLAPRGEEMARWFYEGLPEGRGVPWGAWLGPMAAWCVLLMAFFWVMICLCVVLRRQWSERERLTFPLIQLPLEMVRERARKPLLRSRLLWVGFALPLVLHSFNSIAYFNPLVPTIQLKGLQLSSEGLPLPWRALHAPYPISIWIYPSVIGLTYLIHLDASFSVWCFYLLTKLQVVVEAVVGVEPSHRATLLTPQQAEMGGALAALAVLSLWAARRHLREVWRKALDARYAYDDSQEGLSYRGALLGMAGGTVVIVAWLWAAGVAPWVGAAFLAIFLLIGIALTRVVSETGLMFVQYNVLYTDVIGTAAGSQAMHASTLTGLAMQYGHTWDVRTLLMPNAMHGLKAVEADGLPQRRLGPVMLLACGVALLVGSAATLNVIYKHGGVTLHGWFLRDGATVPFKKLAAVLGQPVEADPGHMIRAGVGAGITLFLVKMRAAYVGWPLHPAGYVICRTPWVMHQIWFSFFAGWLCKWLILRYSGIRGYLFFMPFFLGLVLGEFTTVGAWIGIDYLFGIKHHSIFPN